LPFYSRVLVKGVFNLFAGQIYSNKLEVYFIKREIVRL
jgi:hypothetical protein